MNSILQYVQDMGFFMLILLPLIIIVRVFLNKRSPVKVNILHETGVILFFMIFAGLLSQTILPEVHTEAGRVTLTNGNHQAINLEPFRVIEETYNAIRYLDLWQPFLINFVGNIVMFIPIGFFLPLLWEKFNAAWRTIAAGFLLSLLIEILQLPQMRSSDVDDLWLNTLGTFFGYLAYRSIPNKAKRRFKLAAKG